MNKDDRYVLPYLPVLSVFLAYGLTCVRKRWGIGIRWGTFSLAVLLMVLNLFPVGGVALRWVTNALSPLAQHYPYMGEEYPHRQVIEQIIQTEPYLRSTLAVLPSTPTVNQHNLNYYGALANFQVYGRQVGTRKKYITQDTRSLSWFLTKTGSQGSVKKKQQTMVEAIKSSPDFELNKTWNLPDGDQLKLYHQKLPPVEVKPLPPNTTTFPVSLTQITIPETSPPGVPVPITYYWSGDWKDLQSGLVLLTWQNESSTNPKSQIQNLKSQNPKSQIQNLKSQNPKSIWLHDRAIGMGALHSGAKNPSGQYQVIERTAMLPPADITPGTYTLSAIYLNRVTGQTHPISVPKVTLKIDPTSNPTPAPSLDLMTQFRIIAAKLPKGTSALSDLFEEIARINQYDPNQDYLVQTQQTLEYRLQHMNPDLDWAYTLALSNVLQRRVESAIASLQQVTKLDSENPYAWAYLAFVQLYNFQPASAQKSLEPALAKDPNNREIKALSGVSALLQGNLIKAWNLLSTSI